MNRKEWNNVDTGPRIVRLPFGTLIDVGREVRMGSVWADANWHRGLTVQAATKAGLLASDQGTVRVSLKVSGGEYDGREAHIDAGRVCVAIYPEYPEIEA